MTRFAIVALVLVGSLVGPANTSNGTTEAAIEALTVEQAELAEWALDRYAAAGLTLPPLIIRFPGRDESACGGSPARAYLDHDPIEVRICWNNGFLLLHELGHVWEAVNVPEDHHDRFEAMRDSVTSWAGLDVPWEARGREHAANVIAWGLLDDPYPISKTYPNDPASMTEAFEYLTGVEPLHDGGSGVQLSDRSLFSSDPDAPRVSGR